MTVSVPFIVVGNVTCDMRHTVAVCGAPCLHPPHTHTQTHTHPPTAATARHVMHPPASLWSSAVRRRKLHAVTNTTPSSPPLQKAFRRAAESRVVLKRFENVSATQAPNCCSHGGNGNPEIHNLRLEWHSIRSARCCCSVCLFEVYFTFCLCVLR